jgi:hypothetical protein
MLAYIGPGTGLELIPQFLALLAFAGTAFLAVLLWPITTLWRMIRRGRQPAEAALTMTPTAEPPADAPIADSPADQQLLKAE